SRGRGSSRRVCSRARVVRRLAASRDGEVPAFGGAGQSVSVCGGGAGAGRAGAASGSAGVRGGGAGTPARVRDRVDGQVEGERSRGREFAASLVRLGTHGARLVCTAPPGTTEVQ